MSEFIPNESELPPDPFASKKVWVETPAGFAINALETAKNYAEAMMPELQTSSLRPADRLSIDFDDDQTVTYTVAEAKRSSLCFGEDSVMRPRLICQDEEGKTLRVVGSAISPSGALLSPDSVIEDYYLVTATTEEHVSRGVIRDISVARKDSTTGEYKEVPPNLLTKKPEASQEYALLQTRFATFSDLLKTTGFDFDERKDGTYTSFFSQTNKGQLVYACRQGFGCSVIPQYEIYTYDAATSMLRTMRNIPGEGVFQIATMHIGLRDFLATDVAAGRWESMSYLCTGNLYRASNTAPYFTYTWQDPGQETPTITMYSNTHGLDKELFNAEPGSGTTRRAAIEINFTVDEHGAHAEAVHPEYQLNPKVYASVVEKALAVRTSEDILNCTLGKMKATVPILPDAEIDAMEGVVREVVQAHHSNPYKRER